jgi:hypothetical protein
VALADLLTSRRLLRACNLAYGVTADVRAPDDLAITPPVLPSREVIARLAAAANFEPLSFHAHQSSSRAGIDAFLYGETDDCAILAFRGTLPVRLVAELDRLDQIVGDWFNNARAHLVPGAGSGLPGYVHEGYARSLNALWSGAGGLGELLPRIRLAVAQGHRLLLTGHSKGGALAQMAALRLAAAEHGLRPAGVHTFAAPRAGNHSFANAFEDVFAGSAWRFEFQDDVVPHLPPTEGLWFAVRSGLLAADSARNGAAGERGRAALKAWGQAIGQIGSYESAGRLQFIDWDDKLHDGDTPALGDERVVRLVRAMALSLPEVARAHLPMQGYGYMDFLERDA